MLWGRKGLGKLVRDECRSVGIVGALVGVGPEETAQWVEMGISKTV
jgi:hypothetical protein